jgi:hypothetical protein
MDDLNMRMSWIAAVDANRLIRGERIPLQNYTPLEIELYLERSVFWGWP